MKKIIIIILVAIIVIGAGLYFYFWWTNSSEYGLSVIDVGTYSISIMKPGRKYCVENSEEKRARVKATKAREKQLEIDNPGDPLNWVNALMVDKCFGHYESAPSYPYEIGKGVYGKLANRANREFSHIVIEFAVYDNNDYQVGTFSITINNLQPHKKLRFEEPIPDNLYEASSHNPHCEIAKITVGR